MRTEGVGVVASVKGEVDFLSCAREWGWQTQGLEYSLNR